jgi:hypothetical protein
VPTTVYRVDFVYDVQYLLVDGPEGVFGEWWPKIRLDGHPRLVDWQSPPLYSELPLRPRPDFWNLIGVAGLVLGPRALEATGAHLEAVGELLPLTVGADELQLANITAVYDCMDPATTTRDGEDGGIERYGFHEHRLPEMSIFKVPETAITEVLCVHRGDDPDVEFLSAVEGDALTGLRFDPIWDSERGPLRQREWDEFD